MPRQGVCPTIGCPNLNPCSKHGVERYGHRGWSPGRDRAAQARFRSAVLQRDGYRCVDCGATDDLRACHTTPLAEGGGYRPEEGVTRCGNCDRATDPYAR